MNRDALAQMATSPGLFRQRLVVRAGNRTAPLVEVLAPFQAEALAALDTGLRAVAAGESPPVKKFMLEWTKGCAKTTLIAASLLWLLTFTRRAIEVRIGAGDQEQAGESRLVVKQLIRDNPWLADLVQVDNWQVTNKATGSRIVIVSADAKTQHGSRPSATFVDEMVHIDSEDFFDALIANQAKVPDGLLIVATNCGILGTWQHKRVEYYRQSPDWFFHSRPEPAPWISPRDLAELSATMPAGQFARLFKGVWSAGSDLAIQEADIQAALILPGPMGERDPDYRYFAGVDVGIVHDHAAVVLIGRHQRTHRLRLCRVLSWAPPRGGKINLEVVQSSILALHRQFYPQFMYDKYEMELMVQQLSRQGVWFQPASFSGSAAQEMANSLLEAFGSRSIDLFPHEELVNDLRKLELILKPAGWRLSAARDKSGHADRGIALCLALLAARESPASGPSVPGEEMIEVLAEAAAAESRWSPAAALQRRQRDSERRGSLAYGRFSDDEDEADGWSRQYGNFG